MMQNDASYFAIVAEYRGSAVLEKRGDKRAVWAGQAYYTDGKAYIWFQGGETVMMLGLANESEAKQFIDAHCDHRATLPDQYQGNLMGYRQAWEVLNKRRFEGEIPPYVFNEQAGIFTLTSGVRDGQHRRPKY
jgi:hypothetical protein